jgi:C-terminal processing protease CtpA/Prc
MKNHWKIGLLIVALLGTGAIVLLSRSPKPEAAPVRPAILAVKPDAPVSADVQAKPEIQDSVSRPSFRSEVAPLSEESVDEVTLEEKLSVKKAQPIQLTPEERQEALIRRSWELRQKQFADLLGKLEKETDPDRRKQMIEQLARYVRIDTVMALDWARSLPDEEEQCLAMEFVSKNAYVGIGAHIEMDETGFPKIAQTTELSAIGATGMVEAGDYIVGMTTGDGETTYFEGMTLSQIVKYLQGEVGTEISLTMARASGDDQSDVTTFNVPVTRSMIIVTPPDL